MADNNIFVKGTKFAQTALGLLKKQLKAASLFTIKYGSADFKGAEGDTIGVKRPPVLVARDKGWRNDDEIIVDKLVNTKIQVKLNRHPYSAVELSPEESTLDDVEYVGGVQKPQVDAVQEFFENDIIRSLRGADFIREVNFNPNASEDTVEADARKVAIRGRKLLNQLNVPLSGRYWLVGADVSEAIATHPKLLEVDAAGIPEALREGLVGKLGGFVIVEMDYLGSEESFFVHETAIAIAAVAPVVPQGAAKGGGVAAGNGIAVTQIWDYDSKTLKDRSVVHAFSGATPVLDPEVDDDGRIILDRDGEPQLEFKRAVKVVFGSVDPEKAAFTLTITGSPTGGTFTLTVDGETTEPLPHNATNGAIKDALNALAGVSGVKVTGTGTRTVEFKEFVTFTASDSLTGGTTPGVTITAA